LAGKPDLNLNHWQKKARQHFNHGRYVDAQQCCLTVLSYDPRHADSHFLLGMVSIAQGRFREAADLLERATMLDNSRAAYHAQLARCQVTLNRHAEARQTADRAMHLEPTDAQTLDTIGAVYSRTRDHDKAVEVFREAVVRDPKNSNFQFNLGASLRFIGDFDGAEVAFEAAAHSTPKYYKAHSALSHLKRQTPENNHTDRLETLIRNADGDLQSETGLRSALAKEYDDLGEYDRAFAHMAKAYAKLRPKLDYSTSYDDALFEKIISVVNEEFLSRATPGHATREPIFIVGMPRTGTTLVERILSSHSEVFSAGELQNFGIALKRATRTKSNRILDPETIAASTDVDFAKLGETYLDSTRPVTGHTAHFIDKTPLNFLHIGFIHLALPAAKIICLRRNPMDSCLSNYRQLFALDDSPYYNYSYDLLETGHYYILFDRLMQHWRRLLPGKILELQYETVVAEQEAQSRAIVDFCGLEWEDACLAFERNPSPVATASATQVREPIYTHAVERWRHYEKHLAELKQLLEAEGIVLEDS
jgi:tetratricopeptide (TPR) repeat protein